MLLPQILFVAKKKRLFDLPDARKVHRRPIPRLGGVSFFPVILFTFTAICIVISRLGLIDTYDGVVQFSLEICAIIAANLLLFAIGVKDDLIGVRYRQKLVIQFLAASVMVAGGCWINNLNGFLGIYEISPYIGIPFTIGLVMFMTNTINLIDGADGLASGISGVAVIALGILFYIRGLWMYSLVCAIILGLLIPFFYYNVFKTERKIFMGDTGSLTLGIQLSFLAVRYSMDQGSEIYPTLVAPTAVALSCLFVPIIDALRVMLARMKSKKSPFSPDRRHIHHKLMDLGFPHKKIIICLVSIALFIIGFNYVLIQIVGVTIVLILDFIFWLGFIEILNYFLRKKGVIKKGN